MRCLALGVEGHFPRIMPWITPRSQRHDRLRSADRRVSPGRLPWCRPFRCSTQYPNGFARRRPSACSWSKPLRQSTALASLDPVPAMRWKTPTCCLALSQVRGGNCSWKALWLEIGALGLVLFPTGRWPTQRSAGFTKPVTQGPRT